MIFALNLVILVLVISLISYQITKYNELMFYKYRFRYFDLRDRLALLVINGELEENSWEYQKIVNTINFHINAVEKMSIHRIMNLLVRYHTSPEEERDVEIIEKQVDNEKVLEIMADFMQVTGDLIYRNSRMQIRLINFVAERDLNQHSGLDHKSDQNLAEVVVEPQSGVLDQRLRKRPATHRGPATHLGKVAEVMIKTQHSLLKWLVGKIKGVPETLSMKTVRETSERIRYHQDTFTERLKSNPVLAAR